MKKGNILLPLLFAGLYSSAITVNAEPSSTLITILCPGTQMGSYTLSNFGHYVGGYGRQQIFGNNVDVYFKSLNMPYGIPLSLVHYYNSGTLYNPTNGSITCYYKSNLMSTPGSNCEAQPDFNVTYTMANGKGGAIQSYASDYISFLLPVGLRG